MGTQSYQQAIIEQNPHWEGVAYVHDFQRLHNQDVLDDVTLREMQIITGIRRCGKSTVLETVINHLMEKHDPKSILYINFDDPNYTSVYNDSAALYDVITAAEKLSGKKVAYLFLDEIQNVEAMNTYFHAKARTIPATIGPRKPPILTIW